MTRRPMLRTSMLAVLAVPLVLSGCRGEGPVAVPPVQASQSTSALPSQSPTPTGPDEVSEPALPRGVALPDEEQGEVLGQFVNFALRPDTDMASTVGFAKTVDLGVGTQVRRTLTGNDFGNPRRWRIPLRGVAQGRGTTSALDLITDQSSRALKQEISSGIFGVTAGAHPRCTADPSDPLDGYELDQQLSVMPGSRSIDSCAQWFAVDLYTDEAGDIAAVRVDLIEP